MRRIAFLSFDWDYKIVSEYYLGMQDYLKEHDGVQVVVFNAFGQYYASHMPKASTFEVFSLFNPKDYDGLLIQGNRTWPPELRQKIVDNTVALDKPVVSINYDLAGARNVGTNNYQEEYDLVHRVLSEQGCKHPAFVNGLKTSVEAQARAKAYRDACKELGITDVRFYQANWQKSAGVVTAMKMLRKQDDLPDVIFCCNDDLALGIQETFQDAGLRIPEDVMITGFDNREISARATPRITTIDRDYKTIGKTALDAILKLLDGNDLPIQVFSPAKHIMAESCGYTDQPDAERLSNLNMSVNSLERFHEVLSNFQSAIMGAESLYATLEICEMFAQDLDCGNAFVTFNDSYLQLDIREGADTYGPVSHLMACKGRDTALTCNGEHLYASFASRQLLPEEVGLASPIHTVSPLRHNETCIGTVVTEGVPTIMTHGFTALFLTALAGAIHTMKMSEFLKAARTQLGSLHVYDDLTGLFNQRGMDYFGVPTYERLLQYFDCAFLALVDIDNMEGINEAHGRKTGDDVLRDVAGILRHASMGENAFIMRGDEDEFLLISHQDLRAQIDKELELFRSSAAKPYDLSLSTNVLRVTPSDDLSLGQALDSVKADKS